MNSLLPGDTWDLRGAKSPLNVVRSRLMIEEITRGELLEILLDVEDRSSMCREALLQKDMMSSGYRN
ncbi:MAG: hypothetical protein ABR903_08095 [Thermodesulfovibrionales bacterium]|jgi:TusA-related sulfurtransferase